jgi:hypothetical protein
MVGQTRRAGRRKYYRFGHGLLYCYAHVCLGLGAAGPTCRPSIWDSSLRFNKSIFATIEDVCKIWASTTEHLLQLHSYLGAKQRQTRQNAGKCAATTSQHIQPIIYHSDQCEKLFHFQVQ